MILTERANTTQAKNRHAITCHCLSIFPLSVRSNQLSLAVPVACSCSSNDFCLGMHLQRGCPLQSHPLGLNLHNIATSSFTEEIWLRFTLLTVWCRMVSKLETTITKQRLCIHATLPQPPLNNACNENFLKWRFPFDPRRGYVRR